MKQDKSTKRALTASIVSLLVCVTMLIGTTFAWFTDTATASVNKIESGTLGIELQMKGADGNWTSAENKTLSFVKKGENDLWEPGCTYELPELKVVNTGNLAVKYKLQITGITGDAKLNDVIDWTVNDEELSADLATGAEYHLAANAESGALAIKGHMQETAGNEYQGLQIDGITVKVVATQDTVEYDSTNNTYDENAVYPDAPDMVTGSVDTEKDTVLTSEDKTVTVTVPAASVDTASVTSVSLKVDNTSVPGNFNLDTNEAAVSKEIQLVDQNGNVVTAESGKFFTFNIQYEKNLAVKAFYHKDTQLTPADSKDAVASANDRYYYDAATGILTFNTDDFSPFTLVAYKLGSGTEEDPYLIASADQALAMKTKSGGYFKLVEDIVVPNEIYLSGKTYTLDLNGHSLKLEYGADIKPNNGSVLYIGGKNGKLTIQDSSAEQTGKVIGSDQTYTNKVTSAVRAGNYGKLDIYGGHFYGMSAGTSCIFVCTSTASGTKATVNIYGGKFETATPNGNIYYVLNHQDSATTDCTITVHGGSFKNYNPGVTEVDPVNAKTGTIKLADGYKTTTTTEGSDTWYTVSK